MTADAAERKDFERAMDTRNGLPLNVYVQAYQDGALAGWEARAALLREAAAPLQPVDVIYPTAFPIALMMAMEGARIRRDDWNRPAYVEAREIGGIRVLALVMKDGTVGPYTPSHCDMFARDWRVVESAP